jgi:hypothetical protein
MSGRGRGRGRSGRGTFHGKPSISSLPRTKNQESKKSITDWTYYIGSAKQASEYETTTEFLVNHIKETFEFGRDIAIAIVNQALINTDAWKPRLQKSADPDPDPDTRATENEQYRMEFQANFNNYGICDCTYTNNIIKAYALFWGKCAKGMKNKIEARSDFKSKIENDPFELLKMIKEHLMSYQENCYNMSVILDSLMTLLTTLKKRQWTRVYIKFPHVRILLLDAS